MVWRDIAIGCRSNNEKRTPSLVTCSFVYRTLPFILPIFDKTNEMPISQLCVPSRPFRLFVVDGCFMGVGRGKGVEGRGGRGQGRSALSLNSENYPCRCVACVSNVRVVAYLIIVARWSRSKRKG